MYGIHLASLPLVTFAEGNMLFQDRHDAGKQLAERLHQYRGTDAIVLGLPRGGVVVAYEVARALDLPLDVVIVRKIGAPGNPEYAIGALAENGELTLNEEEIEAYGIPRPYVEREVAARGLRTVRLLPRVPYGEAVERMREAAVALGIFGTTEKAGRVTASVTN